METLKRHQECPETSHSNFAMLECNDLILEFINILHSLTMPPTQTLHPFPSSSWITLRRPCFFLLLLSGRLCQGMLVGAAAWQREVVIWELRKKSWKMNEMCTWEPSVIQIWVKKNYHVHRVYIKQNMESKSKGWEWDWWRDRADRLNEWKSKKRVSKMYVMDWVKNFEICHH